MRPDDVRTYSSREKPHSEVSTRTSTFVCSPATRSHKYRACATTIRCGAQIAISRSLVSVVTGRPVANSNPTLPVGPHGKVKSHHLSLTTCKTFNAGVRGLQLAA